MKYANSKISQWMGTAATGPGGEAVSATGIEAYRWDTDQKHAASQDARPETQAVKPTNEVSAPVGPPQNSVGQPVHGGIFAAYPPSSSVSKNDESSPSAVEDLNSPVADPAVPIRSLARRPALETHKSVATVSDLHVPGEFPKGFSPTERY